MPQNEIEKLRDVLQTFQTAVLVTHTDQGRLHARPMAVAQVEHNCNLWFITGKNSAKVHEIESDQDVLVVFQDGWNLSASVSGLANLVDDRQKLDEIWNEHYKVWFPKGKNDPDIALIHVTSHEAQYWDNKGKNKLKYLFEAAKAYVQGTRPEITKEQYGEVRF